MKAVLLAAGIGSRLRPITNEKPKTLVEVNGKPIISYLLDSLKKNNIKDIIVCIGFKSENVINYCETNYPDLNFYFIENKNFDKTNNMYSFYLAKKYLDDDIILMNADIIFDDVILRDLKQQKKTSIAVDKGRYNDESMKIVVDEGKIKSISKKIAKDKAYGCSIDLYKINKKDLFLIIAEMERIIENNKDLNQWVEVVLDNLFKNQEIIAAPFNINPAKWYEIDDFNDLYDAEILFNNKIQYLKNKKIFFIDRDGTLSLENEIIQGSPEFIDHLKKNNKIIYILTNNSSNTPKKHLEKVKEMGLNVDLENILVSIEPALNFLKENGFTNLYWVANKDVSEHIKSEGFVFNEKNPKAILLTYDTEINYKKLEKTVNLIRKGLPYYATHKDIVKPTKEGCVPDIGTFIKLIEMTTGKLPNKTFGKPEKSFIESTLKKHNMDFKDAVVIGDRIYTDIMLAKNSEMMSVLVLTGETKREDYEKSTIKADITIKNLEKIINFI